MRVMSLFAGIGGFDLGLERSGFTLVAQVEKDPHASRVLAARWPHVTCWPDVREWAGDGHEPVDLLCGGFPCQDLSVAGKRKGITGERSGLYWEIVRIAKAIKPTWGLFENVPGLFTSGGGRDMATVLEGLRQCWPVVGYAVLDSQYFGVPQRRRRVFFVCGPSIECVEQVLVDAESSHGDLTTSDEARPHLAASLRSRSARPGVNPPGRGGEDDMNLVCALTARDSKGVDRGESSANSKLVVAACLNSGGNSGGFRTEPGEHLVPMAFQPKASSSQSMNPSRLAPSMGTSMEIGIYQSSGVRRLTPTECERLQGFPDGWTCLCQPLEAYDANRCTCSDGYRYKCLGNAVTVPVIEWLGGRIVRVSRAGLPCTD